MKFKHIALFAIIFVSAAHAATPQANQYKSVFMFHFTKYIQWPANMSSGEFVIGVLGNSDVYPELEKMVVQKKETKGQNLVVKKITLAQASQCNIVFLPQANNNQLNELKSAAGKGTLIVTESPGLAKQGADINFVEQDGKIKFELNKSAAESKDLKVSSELTKLAIII